jgi:Xaa-Pro aminopeptidase
MCIRDRYFEAVERAAVGTAWQVVLATEPLLTIVAARLNASGASRVAVEASISHARFRALEAALECEVVEADGWVEELRAAKDDSEVRAVRAAQELTDHAFDYALSDLIRAGAAERDVALQIEYFMRSQGSEGVAFAPIVASGPNAALPHAVPSRRVLHDGDFVVLDFGARVDGYCADMTRTVVIGSASERQREIYDAVRSANQAAESSAKAGMTGAEIDAVARGVLAKAGLGEFFGHGLGHGVGLQVHELPRVGPRAEAPVPRGAVITIEPGVYIPGFGGVRIENLAVVKDDGVEVLARSATELLEL